MIFCNLNYNCSNLLDLRNFQEQVKKAFCYNCSDLSLFESDLKVFLTVGQNNFGNKIPFFYGDNLVRDFFYNLP